MASDFTDEKNGYLHLREDDFRKARTKYPQLKGEARAYLAYGETKRDSGHPTSSFHILRMCMVKISDVKYPKEGYHVVFILDHSSCHTTFADNALNAYKCVSSGW